MTKYFIYTEHCVRCKKTRNRRLKHTMKQYGEVTQSESTGTCQECKVRQTNPTAEVADSKPV